MSSDLRGQWQIIGFDGREPLVGRDGKPPILTFDENGYGGYAGCNSFGGQGLVHEGRFYGGFPMSTAMACGPPFDDQETAVQRLLRSAPLIEWTEDDRVALITSTQRLDLHRSGPLPDERSFTPNIPLIGTAWSFGALDGRAIEMPGASSGPTLIVEGDLFTLTTPCLTMEGTWNQILASVVELTPVRNTSLTCNTASRGQSEAWAQAMRGTLRYTNGPNGEILLAGGGHWMVGDLIRRGSSDASSLAGRYELESGSTAQHRNNANPAELILNSNAFYLWDGCNRTEGLAIAFERQLFLHGSGITTLANCLPDGDEERMKHIVLSDPRIGRITGGLLLSSPVGTVRLRRIGDAPPGAGGVTTRLSAGMSFTLMGREGGTLAILPGNRFRLTVPCGNTEGRWRAGLGEKDGAVRFGPDRTAAECERTQGARALQNAFLGNLDVVIGPNRDIALFAGRFGAVRARLDP